MPPKKGKGAQQPSILQRTETDLISILDYINNGNENEYKTELDEIKPFLKETLEKVRETIMTTRINKLISNIKENAKIKNSFAENENTEELIADWKLEYEYLKLSIYRFFEPEDPKYFIEFQTKLYDELENDLDNEQMNFSGGLLLVVIDLLKTYKSFKMLLKDFWKEKIEPNVYDNNEIFNRLYQQQIIDILVSSL